MNKKEMTLVFYGRKMMCGGWDFRFDEEAFAASLAEQQTELARFGIELRHVVEQDVVLEVKGYGDLLNTVRHLNALGIRDHVGLGAVLVGRGDADVGTRRRTGQQAGLRHVAAAGRGGRAARRVSLSGAARTGTGAWARTGRPSG